MLVVDLHTLHAVDVLNLVDDIFLHGSGTLDVEDIGRSDGSVGKRRSGTHIVVFLNKDLLGERHKVLLLFAEFARD